MTESVKFKQVRYFPNRDQRTNEFEIMRNNMEQDLLQTDDEIDLIWCLPHLPEKERVQETVKA